ncbi:MAG: DegV family EDD domain-containing protein [Dehalococcoidales bacterium]|nr:DegV family EDD domain-containing protein [Dehalococcoidales bacterium]
MSKVAVLTDTVTEMPQELADEYCIKLAPISIIIDGKQYPENEIDLVWYRSQIPKWKELGKIPSSSAISVGHFLEAYRELSREAEAVLYVGHSSQFGVSVSNARQAQKLAGEELPRVAIEVVDTYTVCGAQMLIAIEAARAAAAGQELSQVAGLAHELVKKVNMVALFDDLSLLAKGGRIHKVRPWASSRITNTTLLEANSVTGGQMTPLARCRTRPQVVEKLFETIAERSQGGKLHVAINHVDSLAEAEELKELAASRFPCAEVFITPLYPLVINHTGLESLQFCWWSEN